MTLLCLVHVFLVTAVPTPPSTSTSSSCTALTAGVAPGTCSSSSWTSFLAHRPFRLCMGSHLRNGLCRPIILLLAGFCFLGYQYGTFYQGIGYAQTCSQATHQGKNPAAGQIGWVDQPGLWTCAVGVETAQQAPFQQHPAAPNREHGRQGTTDIVVVRTVQAVAEEERSLLSRLQGPGGTQLLGQLGGEASMELGSVAGRRRTRRTTTQVARAATLSGQGQRSPPVREGLEEPAECRRSAGRAGTRLASSSPGNYQYHGEAGAARTATPTRRHCSKNSGHDPCSFASSGQGHAEPRGAEAHRGPTLQQLQAPYQSPSPGYVAAGQCPPRVAAAEGRTVSVPFSVGRVSRELVTLLKQQTEEKETALKNFQNKEAALVTEVKAATEEIARLQSLMADELGAEVITSDAEDSDELMPTLSAHDTNFSCSRAKGRVLLLQIKIKKPVSKQRSKMFGTEVVPAWPSSRSRPWTGQPRMEVGSLHKLSCRLCQRRNRNWGMGFLCRRPLAKPCVETSATHRAIRTVYSAHQF